MSNKIKIIFFGSFDFAVPTLEKLATISNYEIVAVVTNPDRPAGRKKVLTPSPVKSKALELGVTICQPGRLRNNKELLDQLKNLNADLGVVVGYSKILPEQLLNVTRLGLLNIHPSLLPKYRGPSPVAAAILNAEKQTGVTIIQLDTEMDHGPILAQKRMEIKSEDTAQELYGKLFSLGTDLLIETLPGFISGNVELNEQDHSLATFSKMIRTEDGEIKDTDTVALAVNKVRALNPEPGTFAMVDGKRLKILEATCSLDATKPHLKLSDGLLELIRVQPEGGKPMSGQDWLRGRRD